MATEEDTEWLRVKLSEEEFHHQYRGQWIAARDSKIVFNTEDRGRLVKWIEYDDPERTSVLAYADDRAFV